MIIFDNRFSQLREKHIFPLINYGITFKNSKNFDLKTVLVSKADSVDIEGKNYYLKINKNLFFSSLVRDIELFYSRMTVQYIELHKHPIFYPVWQYVTSYYLFFFSITTLFRLNHNGFVFLNDSQAKQMSDLFTILSTVPVKLNSGNYSFSVLEIETDYVIINLASAESDVHKKSWAKAKQLIDELLKLSNKDNDELSILEKLSYISNDRELGSSFVSETRNKVNYNGIYGLETKIPIYPNGLVKNFDLFEKQLNYYKKPERNDTNSYIKYSCLYGSYIFSLTHKLYEEYRTRSRKPNNDFHNLRADLLKRNDIQLNFLDNC